MKIQELMTPDPATCGPEEGLQEVARKFSEHDCGMIPVVDDQGKPLGAVTDRDIACRAVAEGKNPLELKAKDIMSKPPVTVSRDHDFDEVVRKLEENQLRRVIVTDDRGHCCGVVAQADIARHAPAATTSKVVREVSQPND